MHIAFLNPQGNFDKNDSRWASHPDFGGQLVYVKELAVEMANLGHKVDIITRKIEDAEWPEFSSDEDYYDGVKNVRILRIPFGGKTFLNKEALWPYLCTEYTKNIIKLYKSEASIPDAVTSHYGDGGLSAAHLKYILGVPYTFTGHSLGAQKMDKLKISKFNIADYDSTYNFTLRILAERISMNRADKIITSTTQERFSQYTHTAYQEAVSADKDSKFSVIPPGVSLKTFDLEKNINIRNSIKTFIEKKMKRDISSQRLKYPSIISSSRLDPKKNIKAIVEAFAKSESLQNKSNLIIITRGYDDPLHEYHNLANSKEKELLYEIISIIDRYSLRGKVSIFSIDNQKDLADMYRYFARSRSVFCLAALYEPFGLAPLEAMACGLPAVVTKFGGPAESLSEGDKEYGVLVDPKNPEEIANGLYSMVCSEDTWNEFSKKGYSRVQDKYTWKRTAEGYLKVLKEMSHSRKKRSYLPFHQYFIDPEKEPAPEIEVLNELYLKYDIICAGETGIDFISTKKTNSLKDADNFTRHLGGNPAYVAVYVSKLSKKAALLTKIGKGKFGDFLERQLQKYGVCTEFISQSEEYDTSVTFLTHTPSVPDFQIMRSADKELGINEIDHNIVERADVIYTSLSSLSHEPARAAIRKVLRVAKRDGKMIVLDPNYDPMAWKDKEEALEILAEISSGVSIVKPSITDARHIFDYNLKEDELIKQSIKTFHDWGAGIVLLTSSGKYVIVAEKGKKNLEIKDLPPVDVIDYSGCGEAFMAGFIVAHIEKLPLEQCTLFAHEIAAIALRSIGPFPKSINRQRIIRKIQEAAKTRS